MMIIPQPASPAAFCCTDTVGAITGGIAGIIYGLNAIPEEWISKLVNKMIVLNAASDLYKKCNKDNIIDNLDFSV